VILSAKKGSELCEFCELGDGISCTLISAGRKVGYDGSTLGGSSCISVTVLVMLAIGASLVRMWKHVSRNLL
jgi:hypothetical protein